MKSTLTLLTALLLAPLASLHAADSRPNIVFLFSDDQTIGAMGCYGNKEIVTPHMDKLAADGVRFRNHYNTTSICMASRASVMTGLHEVHWYYAGHLTPEDTAVKSTEELFHLKTDRTEMTNVAAEAQFASQLAAARAAYDAELSAMKTKVIAGHGYEAYPILFDRTTAWLSKESLVKEIIGNGASEGGNAEARGNRANADKSNETSKVKQE